MADSADTSRKSADAALSNRFARPSDHEGTVRQSISLSNLAGLRSGLRQADLVSPRPDMPSSSPWPAADDATCETTPVTPRVPTPVFVRSPSAPPCPFYTDDDISESLAVSPDQAQRLLRSHAILSEPPGSTTRTEASSSGSATPRTPKPGARATTDSWVSGALLSSLSSPTLSTVAMWLGGQSGSATEADSAPPPPASPPPSSRQVVRSASEGPPRIGTPSSLGPFATSPIPVAPLQTPPPGYHEQFWPQAGRSDASPPSPAAAPAKALVSLRRQSSCRPRSQPIDIDPTGACTGSRMSQDSGAVLASQSSGLTCRTRGPVEPLPRPQSAPSGSPLALSPGSSIWSALPWPSLSLSQAFCGATSVESNSTLSEPALGTRSEVPSPRRARKPLDSFPLALEDIQEHCASLAGAAEAAPAGTGVVSAAPQPSMFTSFVSAMFGQDTSVVDTPALQEVASDSTAEQPSTLQMPVGAREGNCSTVEIVQAAPERMMYELGAMFDERWAVELLGDSSSATLGVGEWSLLGHASRGAAGCAVERMWSHRDELLNVSFVLDRHHLRDGLYAYRSRLRVYGASAANACTFLLRDDVIRSGNPSMLQYDRLGSSGGGCGIVGAPESPTTSYPESGILHSCISMPGFLKTRQYIACRRVWKWDDQSKCLIVSIPFAHPDSKELCKGKGSLAEDYRMGYIARPFTDEFGTGAEICTVCFENFGVMPFVANGLAQATLWSTSKTFVSNFRSFEEAIKMAGTSGDIMATFHGVQAVHDSTSSRKRGMARRVSLCILGSIGSGLLGARMVRRGR